ncbi:hypothetical protein C8T65DRAFT_700304 [Cerioporus squamosus]|nr:hypothetical protein C8T65DRAFT_700304 [Cerioporus squamosus]
MYGEPGSQSMTFEQVNRSSGGATQRITVAQPLSTWGHLQRMRAEQDFAGKHGTQQIQGCQIERTSEGGERIVHGTLFNEFEISLLSRGDQSSPARYDGEAQQPRRSPLEPQRGPSGHSPRSGNNILQGEGEEGVQTGETGQARYNAKCQQPPRFSPETERGQGVDSPRQASTPPQGEYEEGEQSGQPGLTINTGNLGTQSSERSPTLEYIDLPTVSEDTHAVRPQEDSSTRDKRLEDHAFQGPTPTASLQASSPGRIKKRELSGGH